MLGTSRRHRDAPGAATEQGRRLRDSAILRGSSVLTASVLVIAAGGALFWAIAARVTTSDNVGRVAALASAIAFLTYLCALTLVPAVARFGVTPGHPARVVHNLTLAVSMLAAGALAIGVATVVTVAGIEQLEPLQSVPGALAFAAIAAGASGTILVEIRLLGQGRYGWIIARSAAVAVTSVLLVAVVCRGDDPLPYFLAGTGVVALSGPVVWLLAERHDPQRFAFGPFPPDARSIVGYLGLTVAGTLVARAAPTSLPLLVALAVSSDENAKFFLAWNIALLMYVITQNVATTLLADAGRTSPLAEQTRHALVLGLVLSSAMAAVTQLGATLVESVYGGDYEDSVAVIRVLSIAAIPMACFAVANAVANVRHLSRMILALPLILVTAVLLPVFVMWRRLTIMQASVAWLAGATLAGLAGLALLWWIRDRPFAPAVAAHLDAGPSTMGV